MKKKRKGCRFAEKEGFKEGMKEWQGDVSSMTTV